ncbi:MAG: transcriptional repressor [Acidimicrobiia bacterium]|nr:transcriptional repressor [Acidimicrobiia bacterium]
MNYFDNEFESHATSALKQIDSRLTQTRISILSLLKKNSQPMTVVDISKIHPEIAQSSLYRNLILLEEAGLIKRFVTGNEFAYYELSDELLGHHHHLRCAHCGEVLDIELTKEVEAALIKLEKALSKKYFYINIDHHLDFVGRCKKCIKKI